LNNKFLYYFKESVGKIGHSMQEKAKCTLNIY
jgi:hypothetical protein